MGTKNIRVLLVDDEKDFLDAIGFFLKAKGYDVTICLSGRDAVQKVRESKIDIVFLDYQMPDQDGMSLLEELRKMRHDLPVIIVTAYSGDLDVNRARVLGVSGIFPKTDTFVRLESTIEVVLRQHKHLKTEN